MPRNVTQSRLLLLLILALTAAWMYCFGRTLPDGIDRLYPHNFGETLLILASILPYALVRCHFLSYWFDILSNARLSIGRATATLETISFAGFWWGMRDTEADRAIGLYFSYPRYFQVFNLLCVLYMVCAIAVVFVVWLAARGGQPNLPETKSPFFLADRIHISSRDSHRYLLALLVLGVLFWTFFLSHYPVWHVDDHYRAGGYYESTLPDRAILIGYGFIAASALVAIQAHWHRAVGFVPWAFGITALALFSTVIWRGSTWPLYLLGAGFGLAHSPLLAAQLAAVPRRQRFAAIALRYLIAVLILLFTVMAYRKIGLENVTFRWHVALAAATAFSTVLFTYLLFRPFVELINELVFRILWYPVAYGPGKYGLPTRGPALIVANHAAMFDPVWLSGVLPLRNRAMMISTVLDKPFLKWLCGRVYEAIRVPAEGFRRVAPEIDEAVDALKHGDSVMIFPESFLRRKEEQPIRRFANGVHRILSQCPDTPVITCWIEDGWGSWTSWKNGPPGKNKPKDIVKKIRIGINEPEILPRELLADNIATRRYLMQRVLHARTHLGLPEYPMPGFAAKDDKEEKDE